MKNLKTIITVIAISLVTTFTTSASDKNNSSDDKKTLRTEIVSLMGTKIDLDINESCTAEISFIINKTNEVVVVSVDSKSSAFKSYVKNKLNYKKIKLKNIKKGEIYKMPIKLYKK